MIGAAIVLVPPAPTSWGPFLLHLPPLAPWPAVMEINLQSGLRGGGAPTDQQNVAFTLIISMFTLLRLAVE